MSELTTILPQPRLVTFAGVEREIKPINFNTLAKIEDRFGSVDALDLSRISSQRFVVWVILQSTDRDLTEEQVGEMLSLDNAAATSDFITEVFRLSGLSGAESESVPGKKRPVRA